MRSCHHKLILISLLLFSTLKALDCRWKFPGMDKRDMAEGDEEDAFEKTMNDMQQPGEDCNVLENEKALEEINNMLKGSAKISEITEHFKKHTVGRVCRYDLSVCDPQDRKCECNANSAYDHDTKTCRIRIGWPCTDGEAEKPKQCVEKAACKPWEGPYSYDTETFPTVSDFFTDSGKYYCRCNDEDDADCGGAGDDVGKRKSEGTRTRFTILFYSLTCSGLLFNYF